MVVVVVVAVVVVVVSEENQLRAVTVPTSPVDLAL
jgi:hypothetical protein